MTGVWKRVSRERLAGELAVKGGARGCLFRMLGSVYGTETPVLALLAGVS